MMVYSDHGDGDQGATHWTRHHMTNYRCIGDSEQTYRKVLGRMETKERGVMEEKVYHPIKNETLHGNSFDCKSFDSKKDEQIQRNKGERSTRNIDNEKTSAVDLKTQKLVPQSEYNDPTRYLSVDLPEEKYKKFTSENKCQDSSQLSVSDCPEERLKKSLAFDVKSPEYFYVNSPPVDSVKFRNSVSDEDDEQLFKKVTKDVMNKFNSMQMEWSVSGKKSSKLDIDNTLLYMYAGDGKVELPPLSDECSDQETRNSDDLATDSSGCVTVTKHLESRDDVTSDRREESAFRCDEEAVLVSFINSDEVRVQIQDVLAIDGKVAEEKQSCRPEYALSPPDDINSIRPVITDGNIVTSVSPGIDKKDNRLKVNSNSAESSSSLSSHVNKPGSDGAKNIEKVENKSSGNSENGRSHTGGQGLGNSSKNGRSHTGDQGLGDGRKNGRSHTGGQGLGDGRNNGRSHTEGQGLGDESENGRSHTRGQGFGDDSKNGRSHPGGQGFGDDSKNGRSHTGGQGLSDDSKNGRSHPGGQGLGDDRKNGRSHTGGQGFGDDSKNGWSHTGDQGLGDDSKNGWSHTGGQGMGDDRKNGQSYTGGQGFGDDSKNGRSHTGGQGFGDDSKNGWSHTGDQGLGDDSKNGWSHTGGQGMGDDRKNGQSYTGGQGFGDDSKNGRSHPGGQGFGDDSKNGRSHTGGQGLSDHSKNGWSHPGGQGLGDDSKNGRSHTGDQGLGDGSKNGRSHTGDCSRPPEDGSGDGSIEEKSTDRDKDGINKRSQDQSNRKDDHEADMGAASNAASHRRRDEMKLDFKTSKKKVSYTSNPDEIPPKPPDGAVNHRVSGSAVQPFLAASAGQNDIQHGDLGQYDVLRAVGMLGSNYGTEEGVFIHQQFSLCLVFCLLPGQPVQGAEAPCRVCDVFLPLLTHSSQCLSTLTLCLTCKAVMAVINFHVQHCGMVGETPTATSKDVHSDCPLELCRKMKNKLRQKTIDKVMKLERIWMNTQRHLRQVLAKVKTRRTRPASYSIDDITAAFSVKRSLYEGHASLHVQPSPLEAATSQSVLTGRSGGNLLSFDNLTSAPIDSTTSVSYRSFDVVEICSSLGGLKLPSVVEEQIQPEEARAPSVLESTRSLRSAAKGIRGQGEVAYGERRHLLAIAQTWTELKYSSDVGPSDREEGIILVDDLVIKMGRYRKGVEWQRSTFLGSGMSGKCHLAIDNTNTNVRFCRKKIKLQQYEENELTVWSNLTHPCIVRLYGAVRLRNKIYIFSELMEGGSLANVIASAPYGQLNSWLALQYFQQLLYVLAYLEEKRVIHEDLKTDNILVRAENIRLAVSDFGLACVLPDNQQRTPPDLSPVGGQAQYSPEKASSKGHDFGSDLWAAVCDFVEMLSGYAPWTQRFKQAKLLHYLIYQNSPPLEDIPAGLPDAIYNLIITGWTVDSTQRPSASTLLQHRVFHLLEQNPADPMFTGHIVERDYVEPEGLYSSELEKELESIRRFLDIEAVNNTTAAEADANSAISDRTRHQQSLNTDLIEDMERLMSLPRDIPGNMVATSNVTSMLSESLVATSNVTNMSAAGFNEEMCAASQVNKKRSESMNTVKTNKRDKERNTVKPPSPLDLEEMQNKLFQELATPEPILDYEDHELSYNTVMVDNEDKKFASEKATSPNNKNQEPATEAVMSHVKNTKSTSWTVTSEATPMTVDDGGDLDRYGSLDIYSSGVNEEDLNDYLKGYKTNLSLTTPAVVIPNLSIFNTSIEDDTDAGQGDSDVHTQSTRSSEDKFTMTTSDGHESVTLLTSHLEPIEHDELSMTNWSGGTTSRPTVTGIHRVQLERTRDNHPRSLFLSPSGEFSHVTHLPSEENTMGNFQNIQQNAENQPVQPLRADFELSSAIPHSPENAVQPKSTPVLPTSQRPEIHKSFSFQGSSLKQRRRTSEIDQELAQLQSEFAQDCLQSAHFDVDHQEALLNEIAGVEDEIPAQLDLLIDDDDLFTSPSHMHQSMDSYSSQHQHEDDIVINFFGTNSEVLARFRTSYRNTQWEEIILGVSSQIHEGGYDVFVVQDMAGDQLDLDGMVTTSQDVFVVSGNPASHEWWVRDKQVGMPGMDF